MEKVVRVAYFTGSLEAGGIERFVTNVARHGERERLFQPVVFCLRARRGIFLTDLEDHGIQVFETPQRWRRSPYSFWKFFLKLRNSKLDIIHSQVNSSIFQQGLLAWMCGVPFLITERNCYPLKGIDLWKRRAQSWLLQLLNVEYSANSKPVAQHLSKILKRDPQKIRVFPNGVTSIQLDSQERTQRRKSFGWTDKEFIIGYVSRLAAHKGHILFLDTIRILKERGVFVKAAILGDGPRRGEIEKKIENERLGDCVISFGVRKDIMEFYPLFDLVVLLSKREGMSNAIVEAMAAGLPIVANPVGNNRELLEDECGFLNHSDAPQEIADSFEKLILDADLRANLGRNARRKILELYPLEKVVVNLSEYYRENLVG